MNPEPLTVQQPLREVVILEGDSVKDVLERLAVWVGRSYPTEQFLEMKVQVKRPDADEPYHSVVAWISQKAAP